MNIIRDRPLFVNSVLRYLNMNFDTLKPKEHKDYPQSVFYVNSDNQVMMEYNQKIERVYIHYNDIWSKIESLFHLNYDDVQSIMKVWLEETYELEGVTPLRKDIRYSNSWKRLTNWRE